MSKDVKKLVLNMLLYLLKQPSLGALKCVFWVDISGCCGFPATNIDLCVLKVI